MTSLCVPLTADHCPQMAEQIAQATRLGADMVELRLDHLRDPDLDAIHALMSRAGQFAVGVIITCRLAEEGGNFTGSEEQRVKLFEVAALVGGDYMDIELAAWRRSALLRERIDALRQARDPSRPLKLILSRHDFEKTPADLSNILKDIAREPCDVVKLATKAESIVDSLRVLDALRESAAKRPTIALAMGEAGLLSRVLAGRFGALLTFASLETGQESAPGQVTIADMLGLYRYNSIGPATAVYGVIGCPVGHSMSPAIFNAAFGEIGHDAVYLPLRIEPPYEAFAAFVDNCLSRPWLNMSGCSVTIPHKENLLRYVAERGGEVEPLARRIGAANTLHVQTGELSLAACNTDYRGAMNALCAGIGCTREELGRFSVAVLGAGGVSRAIVAGLRDCGCRVTIYNRTFDRAKTLAAEFGAEARPLEQAADHGADVIINCTSIGMWPNVDDTPLPADALIGKPVVFDTIYNPIETRLLREARLRGCRTVDGVSMFVGQAAAQFERWIGRPAPLDIMRGILRRRLGR
ncbi:MAG: shikimate dehydrogenase [Phycisphaerae bacterium]|nr:shikimate dehydrogenase [Phycisphaerae bacterium]